MDDNGVKILPIGQHCTYCGTNESLKGKKGVVVGYWQDRYQDVSYPYYVKFEGVELRSLVARKDLIANSSDNLLLLLCP